MDHISVIVNIVGLSALFFYQRYRMKLLSEALEKQGKLLEETKSVVSQQATAISSQSTVVDAAVKYSQAFSPDRIEQMVRREMELEHKGEKIALENKVKELSSGNEKRSKEGLEKVMQDLATRISEFFAPVMSRYAIHLLSLSEDKRTSEIAAIDVPETRELIAKIVEKGAAMLEAAKKEGAP